MTTDGPARRELLAMLLAAPLVGALPAVASQPSTFHAVYDDPTLRDRFFHFLVEVFHLYPEEHFHALIVELTAAHADDASIYRALRSRLPGIAPIASTLRYAVPALRKQKAEMARQAAIHLDGVDRIDGYVEIGSPARYLRGVEEHAAVNGPIVIVHDQPLGYGPADVLERGGLCIPGEQVPLDWAPLPASIPDGTIDLVANFIGFHHCPPPLQDAFVESVRRVLRPGGRLLLREHDVADPSDDLIVALAHDVFNAGVGIPWDDNARQVRAFRSVDGWSAYLEANGFQRLAGAELQAGDPTDNALVAFIVR